MRASLSPLSPAEQTLAEQNFYMVNRFLSAQRLSSDEWFDVVIFRYLLTVKNWFRRPELYKYEFSTIVWKAMSSAVHNERQKQDRRIKTISLDAPIPGTDGLSTPVRFCSFSPNMECRKMAGKRVQLLNNYTCRFRPSSLKRADKSGLDRLQAGK